MENKIVKHKIISNHYIIKKLRKYPRIILYIPVTSSIQLYGENFVLKFILKI